MHSPPTKPLIPIAPPLSPRGQSRFFPFLFVAVLGLGIPGAFLGPRVWRGHEAERVRTEGKPATALVLSQTSTGVSINDVTELEFAVEVTAPGRAPWRTTFIQLGDNAIQTGSQIPVRYDPEEPKVVAYAPPVPVSAAEATPPDGVTILVAAILGGSLLFVTSLYWSIHRGRKKQEAASRRLREVGLAGEAKVIALAQESASEDSLYVKLVLEVRAPLASRAGGYRSALPIVPYQVALGASIPSIAVPRVQPGSVVSVLVDPADRNALEIDFRAMGYSV